MPHQRKYVPSHSGGTASQPSRAKRWMSANASQGLSSRLSLSTRCAFVSFTASLMRASGNAKAGGGRASRPVLRLVSLASTSPYDGVMSPHIPQGYPHPRFTSRALGRHAARRRVDLQDRVMDDYLVLELHNHLRLAHRATQGRLLDVSAHPVSDGLQNTHSRSRLSRGG